MSNSFPVTNITAQAPFGVQNTKTTQNTQKPTEKSSQVSFDLRAKKLELEIEAMKKQLEQRNVQQVKPVNPQEQSGFISKGISIINATPTVNGKPIITPAPTVTVRPAVIAKPVFEVKNPEAIVTIQSAEEMLKQRGIKNFSDFIPIPEGWTNKKLAQVLDIYAQLPLMGNNNKFKVAQWIMKNNLKLNAGDLKDLGKLGRETSLKEDSLKVFLGYSEAFRDRVITLMKHDVPTDHFPEILKKVPEQNIAPCAMHYKYLINANVSHQKILQFYSGYHSKDLEDVLKSVLEHEKINLKNIDFAINLYKAGKDYSSIVCMLKLQEGGFDNKLLLECTFNSIMKYPESRRAHFTKEAIALFKDETIPNGLIPQLLTVIPENRENRTKFIENFLFCIKNVSLANLTENEIHDSLKVISKLSSSYVQVQDNFFGREERQIPVEAILAILKIPKEKRVDVHTIKESKDLFSNTLTISAQELKKSPVRAILMHIGDKSGITYDQVAKIALEEAEAEIKQLEIEFKNAPYAKQVEREFAFGIEEFTFDMLQNVHKSQKGENLAFCPVGVSFVMSMLKAGVGPEDQKEIESICHLPVNSLDFQAAVNLYMQRLEKSGMGIANLVYSKESLDPDFIKAMQSRYSEIRNAKPDISAEQVAQELNAFASEQTHGMIPKIVDAKELRLFALALVNAMYFKRNWEHPFSDADRGIFNVGPLNASKAVEVEMMSRTSQMRYYSDDDVQAVEISYKKEEGRNGASMLVVMPKEQGNISIIDRKYYQTICEGLKSTDVKLTMPEFIIKQELDIKEMLKNMNISHLFNQADFKPMVLNKGKAGNLEIGFIRQNTVIKVDKEGTEAAAVTICAIVSKGCSVGPEEMTCDRPFVFFIQTDDKDNKRSDIAFCGVVQNPNS